LPIDVYHSTVLVDQLVSILCTILELPTDAQLQKQRTSLKQVEKQKRSISLFSKATPKAEPKKKNEIDNMLALVEFMQRSISLAFFVVSESRVFALNCDFEVLHKAVIKYLTKNKAPSSPNQPASPVKPKLSNRIQIDPSVKALTGPALLQRGLQSLMETRQKKVASDSSQDIKMPHERKRINEQLWEQIADRQIPIEEVLRAEYLRKFFEKYITEEYATNEQNKKEIVAALMRDVDFWLKIELSLKPMIMEHKHKPLNEHIINSAQSLVNYFLLPNSSAPLDPDILVKHEQTLQTLATILQGGAAHTTTELWHLFEQVQQTVAQSKVLDAFNQFRESSATFKQMKQELEQQRAQQTEAE
jgi:hypothetical protein